MNPKPESPDLVDRVRRDLLRRLLGAGALAAGTSFLGAQGVASASQIGPAMPDIDPVALTDHVWMIPALGPFPSPDNQGFFANIHFVVTAKGVVVLDTGTSLQIGRMALRQIARVTDKPVIAVFNSHYHGDHWLGNQAFLEHDPNLPIHAHADCVAAIRNAVGRHWLEQMLGATDGAIAGTTVTPPNAPVANGDAFDFGDVTLRVHHHGTAHTPVDISVEVVEDGAVFVGDIAMDHRIANMSDGSFNGTFQVFDALEQAAPGSLWLPGHGKPGRDLLARQRELFEGIYENAANAAEQMLPISEAKAMVLADPRVTKYADDTFGFDEGIGKFTSIAYTEAEARAF